MPSTSHGNCHFTVCGLKRVPSPVLCGLFTVIDDVFASCFQSFIVRVCVRVFLGGGVQYMDIYRLD